MPAPPEPPGFLDRLVEVARDTAVQQVVTSIGIDESESVAYFQCDLVGGDVTQIIDRSFLTPGNPDLLELHDRMVEAGTGPLAACFETFLRLGRSLDAEEEE